MCNESGYMFGEICDLCKNLYISVLMVTLFIALSSYQVDILTQLS